jgi:hypothetical protein
LFTLFTWLILFTIGYLIGVFASGPVRPYLLCLPASALQGVFAVVFYTGFSAEGLQFPDALSFLVATVMQLPLFMAGTYWARRKAARGGV